MKQLISAPTQVLQYSSSCIGLTFVNQPILIIDSGICPSLPPNCHHQLILCKLNLKIEFPPSDTCEVWVYGKAQTDSINLSTDQFDRFNLFLEKNINGKVILFNQTMLNVSHRQIVLCDDSDPALMNDSTKFLTKKKKSFI